MQDRVILSQNGQELQQADVNLLGKEASLADDRVFAELLRLAPFNGSTYAKAILPFSYSSLSGNVATVQPGTGAVTVNPFRAIVGSRTAAGSAASDNWQDIRSAVFIGGLTSLTFSQAIGANASGNPRWDLIYVAVASDANGASVTRYVKSPSTKTVSPTTIATTLTTTATIGVQSGTPGATPAFPSLPADTGATIYILLAFVRVINGFTGATVLNINDIYEVAPVGMLSRTLGGTLRPADQQNVQGGTAISSAGTSAANGILAWTGTTNTRPPAYLPPSMVGGDSLVVAMDLLGASNANWTHQNNGIVDASRDWRNRVFRWFAIVSNSVHGTTMPWNGSGAGSMGAALSVQAGYANTTSVDTFVTGMGHSFGAGCSAAFLAAGGAAAAASPAATFNVATNTMVSGTNITLAANAGTGNLVCTIGGVPLVQVIFWIDATSQYSNR